MKNVNVRMFKDLQIDRKIDYQTDKNIFRFVNIYRLIDG